MFCMNECLCGCRTSSGKKCCMDFAQAQSKPSIHAGSGGLFSKNTVAKLRTDFQTLAQSKNLTNSDIAD